MLRYFRPLARTALSPCWKSAVRGKKDFPIPISFWRPPPSVWDDLCCWRPLMPMGFPPMPMGLPPMMPGMGLRAMDEQMRDTLRYMDRVLNERPMWHLYKEHGVNAEIEKAEVTKDGMNVRLNVSHYAPQELSVRVVGDRLVISGKHSNKADEHGYVTREFSRELLIPEEVDQATLASRVTDDGYLIVSARVKADAQPTGRSITVERETGDSDHQYKE